MTAGYDVVLEEDVYSGELGHAAKHNAVNEQVNWLTSGLLPTFSARQMGLKFNGDDEVDELEQIIGDLQTDGNITGFTFAVEDVVLLSRPVVIPIDTTIPGSPRQKPMRLFSPARSAQAGQGLLDVLNGQGGGFDLRYDGSDPNHLACFETRGVGRLELDGLNFFNGGDEDTAPLLMTTNTTLHVHDCYFRGTLERVQEECLQKFIVCGGTSGGPGSISANPNAPFQGYGTRIEGNCFDRGGPIELNSYANNIVIRANNWTTKAGSGTGKRAAVEINGFAGIENPVTHVIEYANQSCNNIIQDNTIEVPGFRYAVALERTTATKVVNNGFWDTPAFGGGQFISGIYSGVGALETHSDHNFMEPAFHMVTGPNLLEVEIDTAQGNRPRFTPDRAYQWLRSRLNIIATTGIGLRVFATTGDYAFLKASGGADANPSYPSAVIGYSVAQRVTDLVTDVNSYVVSSATAAFTPEHQMCPIQGANIDGGTVIARYISPTQVELNKKPNSTLGATTAQIARPPGVGANIDLLEVTRGGHLVTKGAVGAASVAAGGALGSTSAAGGNVPATAVATGTDVTFTLVVKAASLGALVAGLMANITYGIGYQTPRVQVTPCDAAAAGLDVYYDKAASTNALLKIGCRNAPTNGVTYTFDVAVLQ